MKVYFGLLWLSGHFLLVSGCGWRYILGRWRLVLGGWSWLDFFMVWRGW